MTIFLIGYMGSGKSVIGKALAQVLGYDYIDLDDYITNASGMSIPDLFKQRGEIYFRKLEHESISEIANLEKSVIALGGGTPCYGGNMQLMSSVPNGITVYLKATIPTLVSRLFSEKSNRPLITHIKTPDDLTEFIGKHIFERAPFYEQSRLIIQTDDKTIDDIVANVVLELF